MKQVTRPPAQYVVAEGSQFRLVPNEYDKNTYAQCNYTSNRTLIRCKQIRSKDSLSKNGGRCEEHLEFAKILETNHRKEVMRCHSENDTNMQRRRFDPWIASNEYISDEDDYLQPYQDAPQGIHETSNDNFLDNHPLRYAGHYTDKDILKIKMELVQKDIDDLTEFRKLLTAQAQKEHELLGNDEDEDLPTDMVQKRLFRASSKYDRKDYLTLTTRDPIYKQCSIGPEMDDQMVISHVIHSILDKIENKETFSADVQCKKPALPLTNFCIDHIRIDPRQQLFDVCSECGLTAIGGKEPKCSLHLKQCATSETANCSCAKCISAELKDEKRILIPNSELSDEEEVLGNLSKFESMVSPMTQFNNPLSYLPSSPSSFQKRRYQGPPPAQILRPPQMGPPPGTSSGTSYQNKSVQRVIVAPMTQQQIQEQQRLKMEEEEAKSFTCSRVRPIEPTQYGSGKKKLQQQQRLQHHRPALGMNPNSAYQQHKKLIQGGGGTGQKMTLQGWRNQGTSVGQRGFLPGQQSLYPLHSNRPHQQPPPPPPKTIPLERAPEDGEEMSGGRYPGLEPQRRGVPYYKNAAFRRTELPTRHAQHPSSSSSSSSQQLTPSTSTSSSQLLAPPHSPQSSSSSSPTPHIYRPSNQMSRLPMAPHRAIAAGLNPADVGQRPTYRIQRPFPQSPQQQQQFHPGGTIINRRYPSQTGRLMAGGAPRPPGPTTVSYMVQGSSSGGAPSGSMEPEDSAAAAGFSAMKSLDSARQDVRFANINVKTFLSMGNQNFEKMTKEEIEEMAAASESQEKPTRKSAHSSGAIPTTSMMQVRAIPRGYTGRSSIPKTGKEEAIGIPDAVQQVVSTPSIVAPLDTVEGGGGKKRKMEEKDSGEPVPKKPANSEVVEKPEPKTPKKRSTPPTPPTRTPRAAAVAANQALAHHKPQTPSTSATTSSTSTASAPENPLDLLAELSAAAEEEEVQRAAGNTKKTPKKASPATVTQRRSSIGKKTPPGKSEEK